MREEAARAQAREDHPVGPSYTLSYVLIGFVTLFLTFYTLTIAFGRVPIWVVPDVFGMDLLRDMASRWTSWAGGLIGAWIGYKVAQLR